MEAGEAIKYIQAVQSAGGLVTAGAADLIAGGVSNVTGALVEDQINTGRVDFKGLADQVHERFKDIGWLDLVLTITYQRCELAKCLPLLPRPRCRKWVDKIQFYTCDPKDFPAEFQDKMPRGDWEKGKWKRRRRFRNVLNGDAIRRHLKRNRKLQREFAAAIRRCMDKAIKEICHED